MKKTGFALLVCLAAAMASLCLGAAGLGPGELIEALASGPRTTAGRIFWYVRLPGLPPACWRGRR